MNKYIDADALKYYGNHIGDEYEDKFHEVQWVYRIDIDNAPSIDIVRCKECKYWRTKNGITYCMQVDYGYGWKADDFCSYGERRE